MPPPVCPDLNRTWTPSSDAAEDSSAVGARGSFAQTPFTSCRPAGWKPAPKAARVTFCAPSCSPPLGPGLGRTAKVSTPRSPRGCSRLTDVIVAVPGVETQSSKLPKESGCPGAMLELVRISDVVGSASNRRDGPSFGEHPATIAVATSAAAAMTSDGRADLKVGTMRLLMRRSLGRDPAWDVPPHSFEVLVKFHVHSTIAAMTWMAARIYAAGVLLYGQHPSLRTLWRALAEAR